MVKNRILKALCDDRFNDTDVSIYVYDESDMADVSADTNVNYHYMDDDWLKNIAENQIVWIACPSYKHVFYLNEVLKDDNFVIIEKPITPMESELDIVKNLIHSSKRNHVFFLSYYLLEKALPLCYLARPIDGYAKYLQYGNSSGNIKAYSDVISNRMAKLGNLLSVDVCIVEGLDARDWVTVPKYGMQKLETFIHNVIIASQFTNLADWDVISFAQDMPLKSNESPNALSLNAVCGDTKINLFMAKNAKNNHSRCARLIYENGIINADFDKENVIIHLDDTDEADDVTLSVKEEYRTHKYLLQADIATRCYNGEFDADEVDGLSNQVDVIEWLLKLKADTKITHKDVNTLVNKYYNMANGDK